MGKLDAIELWPDNEGFNTLRCMDWYRYLDCGYRLPLVGGTDKMGATKPLGPIARMSIWEMQIYFWKLGESSPRW